MQGQAEVASAQGQAAVSSVSSSPAIRQEWDHGVMTSLSWIPAAKAARAMAAAVEPTALWAAVLAGGGGGGGRAVNPVGGGSGGLADGGGSDG